MINETYFEVLVYTCNQDAFVEKMTAQVDKGMRDVPDRGGDIWKKIREEEIHES